MVKVKLSNGDEIYLDGQLESALDTIIYNNKNDWDFIIIISGDRQVRVGKSVLAQNVAAYISDKNKSSFTLSNIFFDSQEMIDAAQQMPKNSVLVYDEGRESLAASKFTQLLQQNLLDYFAECGQLGHIFIIVLPDFFELKESIAVGRSECLINVYRKSVDLMMDIYDEGIKRPVVRFDRGFFEFFNRTKKQVLYDMARSMHRKNYNLVKPNFIGRFTNHYTVSEADYRQKKAEALQRFQSKREELKTSKTDVFRDKEILRLKSLGLSAEKIAEQLEHDFGYSVKKRCIFSILHKLRSEKNQQNQ